MLNQEYCQFDFDSDSKCASESHHAHYYCFLAGWWQVLRSPLALACGIGLLCSGTPSVAALRLAAGVASAAAAGSAL